MKTAVILRRTFLVGSIPMCNPEKGNEEKKDYEDMWADLLTEPTADMFPIDNNF